MGMDNGKKSARQRREEWSKTPEGRASYERVAEEMRKQIAEGGRSEIPDDLKEAAKEYCPDDAYPFGPAIINRDIRDAFIAGAKWQAEHSPLPEDTVLFNKGVAEGRRLESEENKDRDIVFWRGIQYAKEQMLNDGLDAVKTLDFNKVEKTIAGVFVKYGMDRQKEMMMEEAVEGYVTLTLTGVRTVAATIKEEDNIGFGDKVRVIIVKEDEK